MGRLQNNVENSGGCSLKKVLFLCTTDSMIWNFLIPHIKDLKQRNIVVECACSRTGFYYDELVDKYGFIMHEISFLRSPYNISNIKCLWQLISLISSGGFDVIHCHEPVGGAMGRIAGAFTKCKVIYTAHGFHFYKGNNWISNFIYKNVESFLARFTDVLITINEEDYKAANCFPIKKNGKVYKISGIGCDIGYIQSLTINRSEKRKELGIREDAFVIVTAAEFIPRKNVATGIKAFAKANLPNSVYVLCGDGELEQDLHILVQDLKIENRVIFAGFRKDMKEVLQCCDLFLFPTRQEGLGIAIIEAEASGLPVIVSKVRGALDCIVENKSGLAYDPDDIDNYVKGLIRLYKNENGEYNRMSEFNKTYAWNFDISKVKREMNAIYKEMSI